LEIGDVSILLILLELHLSLPKSHQALEDLRGTHGLTVTELCNGAVTYMALFHNPFGLPAMCNEPVKRVPCGLVAFYAPPFAALSCPSVAFQARVLVPIRACGHLPIVPLLVEPVTRSAIAERTLIARGTDTEVTHVEILLAPRTVPLTAIVLPLCYARTWLALLLATPNACTIMISSVDSSEVRVTCLELVDRQHLLADLAWSLSVRPLIGPRTGFVVVGQPPLGILAGAALASMVA
jgi:hypothetical protein